MSFLFPNQHCQCAEGLITKCESKEKYSLELKLTMWASSELKYEGCSINKLQNGVRFVGNLFLYLHRNFL